MSAVFTLHNVCFCVDDMRHIHLGDLPGQAVSSRFGPPAAADTGVYGQKGKQADPRVEQGLRPVGQKTNHGADVYQAPKQPSGLVGKGQGLLGAPAAALGILPAATTPGGARIGNTGHITPVTPSPSPPKK